MNPNGQNQRWSTWIFTVAFTKKGFSLAVVKSDFEKKTAAFIKGLFGSSAGQWRYTCRPQGMTVEVFIEDTDITPYDPAYQEWVKLRVTQFFVKGFGADITVDVEGKLRAGSREDGRPSDQLLILPNIDLIGGPDGKRVLPGRETEDS